MVEIKSKAYIEFKRASTVVNIDNLYDSTIIYYGHRLDNFNQNSTFPSTTDLPERVYIYVFTFSLYWCNQYLISPYKDNIIFSRGWRTDIGWSQWSKIS